MNVYCQCANKTTMENIKKMADHYVVINKDGKCIGIGGIKPYTYVYKSVYNGEDVVVYTSNVVAHERNI